MKTLALGLLAGCLPRPAAKITTGLGVATVAAAVIAAANPSRDRLPQRLD
jgi:hypothetical protein